MKTHSIQRIKRCFVGMTAVMVVTGGLHLVPSVVSAEETDGVETSESERRTRLRGHETKIQEIIAARRARLEASAEAEKEDAGASEEKAEHGYSDEEEMMEKYRAMREKKPREMQAEEAIDESEMRAYEFEGMIDEVALHEFLNPSEIPGLFGYKISNDGKIARVLATNEAFEEIEKRIGEQGGERKIEAESGAGANTSAKTREARLMHHEGKIQEIILRREARRDAEIGSEAEKSPTAQKASLTVEERLERLEKAVFGEQQTSSSSPAKRTRNVAPRDPKFARLYQFESLDAEEIRKEFDPAYEDGIDGVVINDEENTVRVLAQKSSFEEIEKRMADLGGKRVDERKDVARKEKSKGPLVTVATNDGRLGSVLAILAYQAKAGLFAYDGLDNARVTLIAEQQPLHDVLNMLAKPNGWVWWREDTGDYGIATKEYYEQSILPGSPPQKVFRLTHIEASEAERGIQGLLTPDIGSAASDQRTNKLIVHDKPEALERIARFIEEIDIPVPEEEEPTAP